MNKILTFIAASFVAVSSFAQKADVERPSSYNYNRGIELYQAEKYAEALEYMQRELKENDKNGYAYNVLEDIYYRYEEYGKALTAANMAIKYIPKKDEEFAVYAYKLRAAIYLELADTAKAYADYATAIKVYPRNKDLRYYRAQLLYEQKRWNESDAEFKVMIDIDPGDVVGYLGLGRNANMQKKYDDAIKQFNHVIKISPRSSGGYSFRSDSYIGLKQYDKAADDIVSALAIDHDNKAFYNMRMVADSCLSAIATKLRLKAMKETKDSYWPYCAGVVYEQTENHRKAIEYYKKSMGIEPDDLTANRISDCYDELGDYDMALQYIDKAIAMDAEHSRYLLYKGNILNNAGRSKEAIEVLDKYIELNPDNAFGYYRRGWFKDHSGDTDGAIDDYDLAIALNDKYAYSYLNRGVLHRLRGEAALAEADFNKVIELDTVPGDNNTAHYAYYYLGQKDKAIEFMGKALEKEAKGNYYDAACLYSIMGEKKTAISYLRKALETGFRRFAHIARDRDLNNIRDTQEFKDLVEEFKRKHEAEVAKNGDDEIKTVEESVAEVPFTKENGVCKVVCKINDLPLHFIFDTGASTVSISNVEATFMYKNGYIKRDDVIGKQNFVDANGDVSEGTVINLRRIDFGGFVLDNVRASVVRNQKAPLLLGQSVLGRLGKIEIDNGKQMISITSGK